MSLDGCDLLTICVPTCNQVVVLCDMLEDMIPKISSYHIRFLISIIVLQIIRKGL